MVLQQRPWQLGFPSVGLCHPVLIKRNYFHMDVTFFQLRFLLSQLRQMLAAGWSAEVPMKHQQQPMPQGILQAMNMAIQVGYAEWHCGFSSQVGHASFSRWFPSVV